MPLLPRGARSVSSSWLITLAVLEKAREAAHRLILRAASVHVDDKAVAAAAQRVAPQLVVDGGDAGQVIERG